MKNLTKLLGFALMIIGLYYLGKDIMFTTRYSHGFFGGIAALSTVLTLIGGALMLLYAPKEMKNIGWATVAVGVVLVFAGSRAVLNLVSLWQFFVAFLCMSGGYKLITNESSKY